MSITSKKEVNKFNELSNQWWNKSGKFKILHDFTPPRLKFILDIINNNFTNIPAKEIKILDIGCGGGIITEPLFKLGYNISGIDASIKSIEVAKHHSLLNNLNIPYSISTPETLSKEKNNLQSYDIILALEIIEHVDSPFDFLRVLSSLLKSNGLIFISTINKNFKSLFFAKFFAEYILNWLPKGTHDFSKFISPKDLIFYFNKLDFSLINLNGIKYSIFNNSWNLTKDNSMNYISCFKKKN